MMRANRLALAFPLALLLAFGADAAAQGKPPASASAGTVAAPAAGSAQPGAAGLPPGHPPIGSDEQPPPDDDEAEGLPPGHPPIGGGSSPPSGMGARPGARSFSVDDPSLPRGSIQVQARASGNKPPAGATAKLVIRHQTVASGTTVTEKTAVLDAEGKATFGGQNIGSEWVYGVSLDYAGIPYETPKFQLAPQTGKRVEMNVFETTEDMDAALVGVQAFMYMEPQETAFQVEQLFRFSNLSDKTWRCSGMTVNLPPGFKGFVENEEHGTLSVKEVSGRGMQLSGYAAPGVTQVVVRYQLPFPDSDSARYTFGLPARVAHLRLLAAIPPSMGVRVDGLPPAQPTEGEEGRRLLLTESLVPAGGDQFESAAVNLTGIPTRSPTRWYALGLTLAAIVSGLAVALQARGRTAGQDAERAQWEAARKALLGELENLERAHRAGDVGPRTYEQMRRTLLDKLAALLANPPAGEEPAATSNPEHA